MVLSANTVFTPKIDVSFNFGWKKARKVVVYMVWARLHKQLLLDSRDQKYTKHNYYTEEVKMWSCVTTMQSCEMCATQVG